VSIRARFQCLVEVDVGKWGGGKSVDMDALTEQVNREGRQIIAEALRAKNAKLLGGDKAVFIVLEESK